MSSTKGNRNIRILFPIVIAIWGLFFFRLFDACSPDNVEMAQMEVRGYRPPKAFQKFRYELLPIDRDPFLGNSYIKAKPKTKTRVSSANWPNIQYLGLVSDGTSKSSIFIVNINGQQQVLSAGEESGGIKVTRGNGDGIYVSFQGETRKFEKL